MGEHTPGPWVYRMRPPSEPGAMRDFADIDTAGGMPVTVASFYGDDETNEADAALIAAAPDLLAALRSAVADHCGTEDDCEPECWSHEAREAISKATPSTPRVTP